MTVSTMNTNSALVASFFQRMLSYEGIVRVLLSDARLTAEIVLRGEPETRVYLDFNRFPARVLIDDTTQSGQVQVAIESDLMHEMLIGRLVPGVAFARRQLLLRGSACDLANFIPLFEFAPMLYREHLVDLGVDRSIGANKENAMSGQQFNGDPIPLKKHTRLEKLLIDRINSGAYALGYATGTLRHRLFKKMSLFDVLSAMSRGIDAATPPDQRE